MAKKAYSIKERKELKDKLYRIGLEITKTRGLQNLKLPQILQEAGISKPFFYKFYPSFGDLLLDIIDSQRDTILSTLAKINEDKTLIWEEKVRKLINLILYYQSHGIYTVSPEEEVWIYHHLGEEKYRMFHKSLCAFFQTILESWGITEDILAPEIFGNMLISLAMIRNHSQRSMPFLFQESLDDTVNLQVDLFIKYLSTLR